MAAGKLGKKVGPLPAWAWGVLILAVVGWFFLRSRSASAASAPAATDPSGQAAGMTSAPADPGSLPPGLDPSILQALESQNSMLTQSLLDAYGRTYGGGNYTTATGTPSGSSAPTGETSAPTGGATPPGEAPAVITGAGPTSPYAPESRPALPAGSFYYDPPPNVYAPTATGADNPSAALAGGIVPNIGMYAQTTTSGTRTLSSAAGTPTSLVDPSGHVVNAKGARVGGASADG